MRKGTVHDIVLPLPKFLALFHRSPYSIKLISISMMGLSALDPEFLKNHLRIKRYGMSLIITQHGRIGYGSSRSKTLFPDIMKHRKIIVIVFRLKHLFTSFEVSEIREMWPRYSKGRL